MGPRLRGWDLAPAGSRDGIGNPGWGSGRFWASSNFCRRRLQNWPDQMDPSRMKLRDEYLCQVQRKDRPRAA